MTPGDSISALRERFRLWHWRRSVTNSLALHRRGEARKDGLLLVDVRQKLEISWRARSTHPWDCNLPDTRKEAAFVEQSLADTEAAIQRLFRTFPGADVLDFKVFDVESDRVLIEGIVSRLDLAEMEALAHTSIRMRLRQLGIKEYLSASDTQPRGYCRNRAGTEQSPISSNVVPAQQAIEGD